MVVMWDDAEIDFDGERAIIDGRPAVTGTVLMSVTQRSAVTYRRGAGCRPSFFRVHLVTLSRSTGSGSGGCRVADRVLLIDGRGPAFDCILLVCSVGSPRLESCEIKR